MMSAIDDQTTFTAMSPAPKPTFSRTESLLELAGVMRRWRPDGVWRSREQLADVAAEDVLLNDGPFFFVPGQLGDLQLLPAVVRVLVRVEDQVVLSVKGVRAVVPHARPVAVTLEEQRSAAFSEIAAVAIEVGPGDHPRSADHHLVRALASAAALVPGNEKVVPVPLAEDERRLDLGRPGPVVGHQDRTLALRDRVPLLRLGDLGHVRCELHELQSAPERAEAHPGHALLVENDVRVDRVPQVAVRHRAQDDALILPAVIGRVGID